MSGYQSLRFRPFLNSLRLRRLQVVSLLVNLGLIMLVVMLVLQNRELKTILMRPPGSVQGSLELGESVQPITITSLEGESTPLTGDSTMKYLLFVFSTTCQYCDKNWENWELLASMCSDEKTKAFGVSMHPKDKTLDFLKLKQSSMHTLMGDSIFARVYKISAFPTTILVRGDGRTEGIWRGVLDAEAIAKVVGFLSPQSSKI